MNRAEALRILGLSEDATPDEIHAAYRETAQILHPDRFASNKKLQARATEQFKNLQEAYECLTKKGRRSAPSAGSSARKSAAASGSRASGSGSSRPSAASAASGAGARGSIDDEAELRARLAGIAAARVQLVAQRDALSDERRNGAGFLVIGGIVAVVCSRRPSGILVAIAAIASTLAVWGVVQLISTQRSIATLDKRLSELEKEKKQLIARLDELRD